MCSSRNYPYFPNRRDFFFGGGEGGGDGDGRFSRSKTFKEMYQD